jgi:hypothetical protein
VDPVEELADLLELQLLDRGAAAPHFPFPDRGEVFAPRAACDRLRVEVAVNRSVRRGCQEGGSFVTGPGFDAESSWPAASLFASCWRGLSRGRTRSSVVLVRRADTKAYPTRQLEWDRAEKFPCTFAAPISAKGLFLASLLSQRVAENRTRWASDRNRFTNQRASLTHLPSRTIILRWRHGFRRESLSPACGDVR